MTYQVLARKWRPKTFSDLVGQEHVVKALQNALDEGRLHHAYLLTGTRGVGKTTIARILAKSLNCENAQHGEPCGVCQSCTQIDAGRYVDLLEIDAASNTGIDNIREVLENAQYAPTAGKYKVYIIDEVHMLSKSAFNAMLKTLEEPPEHVKFILATTDPHKVPVTVLSRCLQFVLRNMTAQQVADHLAHVLDSEKIAYDPPALQLLGRAAAGSMRDALSLLDQAIALGSGKVAENDVRQMIGAVDKQYLYELLTGIVNQDGEALLAKAQEMAACAVGFDNALGELAILLQQLALIQAVPSALAHDDPDSDILHRLAQTISGEQIQLYYQIAVHGKRDLGLAPDEYAGFMMTLLRMLAFAPLAAASCDANAVIENTELQSPSAQTAEKETAAKKPQPRPEADAAQTPVQTASAAAMPSEGKTAGPFPIKKTTMFRLGKTRRTKPKPQPARRERRQKAFRRHPKPKRRPKIKFPRTRQPTTKPRLPCPKCRLKTPFRQHRMMKPLKRKHLHTKPLQNLSTVFRIMTAPRKTAWKSRRPIGQMSSLPIPQAEGRTKKQKRAASAETTRRPPRRPNFPPKTGQPSSGTSPANSARRKCRRNTPRGRNTVPTPD